MIQQRMETGRRSSNERQDVPSKVPGGPQLHCCQNAASRVQQRRTALPANLTFTFLCSIAAVTSTFCSPFPWYCALLNLPSRPLSWLLSWLSDCMLNGSPIAQAYFCLPSPQ